MAQIVVINSPDLQSGKTLFSAHLGVMLSSSYKTAVMDCVAGKTPLSMFIAKRYALNLADNCGLSVPNYISLEKDVLQETMSQYDVIVIDSPSDKYLKYADVLITILRENREISSLTEKDSSYVSKVWQAKKSRAADGKNTFRWVVVPNGDFSASQYDKLLQTGKFLGYSIAPQLKIRNAYSDGMKNGVTVLDKDLAAFKSSFLIADLYARRDLKKTSEFIWQNK